MTHPVEICGSRSNVARSRGISYLRTLPSARGAVRACRSSCMRRCRSTGRSPGCRLGLSAQRRNLLDCRFLASSLFTFLPFRIAPMRSTCLVAMMPEMMPRLPRPAPRGIRALAQNFTRRFARDQRTRSCFRSPSYICPSDRKGYRLHTPRRGSAETSIKRPSPCLSQNFEVLAFGARKRVFIFRQKPPALLGFLGILAYVFGALLFSRWKSPNRQPRDPNNPQGYTHEQRNAGQKESQSLRGPDVQSLPPSQTPPHERESNNHKEQGTN